MHGHLNATDWHGREIERTRRHADHEGGENARSELMIIMRQQRITELGARLSDSGGRNFAGRSFPVFR